MRRLSLLVFCLVFVVGCGQSYEKALRVYNDEVAVLERLEKERASCIARTEQILTELNELWKEGSTHLSLQDQDILSRKIEERIIKVTSIRKEALATIDPQIKEQRSCVRKAKLTRDKLKP